MPLFALGGGVLRFLGIEGGVRGLELPDKDLDFVRAVHSRSRAFVQVVKLQDIGMAVRGSNDFALRRRRLLVSLTVG